MRSLRWVSRFAFSVLWLSLMGFAPEARAVPGDYWDRYAAACSGSETASAECRAYAARISREIARLSTTLTPVAPVQCTSETELFLGNGIVIDRVSCGPRAGCGAVTMGDQCARGIPASAQANSASSPLASWCASCCAESGPGSSCLQRGCMSCSAREDVTATAARMATQGVAGLRECFATRYPNRALLQSVMRAYGELGASTGIRVSCPSNRDGNDPTANANASTGQINLFPGAEGDSTASRGLFAHEFMHLTGRCSAHQRIDNQDTATHNMPNAYQRYAATPSGAPSPVGAPRAFPNRYQDRVYSCANLCFPSELLSKEECSSCMNFGTSATGIHRTCASMSSLSTLEALRSAERERRTRERECREGYATALAEDRRNLFSARADSSSTSFSYRGITNRSAGTSSDCLTGGYRDVEQAAEAALAESASDGRNASMLRFALRRSRLGRIRYQMIEACDRVQDIREAQRQCRGHPSLSGEMRASICSSNQPPTPSRHGGLVYLERQERERLAALGQEWNTAASDSADAQDFEGTRIQATAVAENYCASIPNVGLNMSSVITTGR